MSSPLLPLPSQLRLQQSLLPLLLQHVHLHLLQHRHLHLLKLLRLLLLLPLSQFHLRDLRITLTMLDLRASLCQDSMLKRLMLLNPFLNVCLI